jgi:hypothetical protein
MSVGRRTSKPANCAPSETVRSISVCAWSATTITAWLGEELIGAAGGLEQARELAVGLGDRGDLRVGAELVRVVVVVGQREQQEVEQVVAHEVVADAAGVAVAHAGHAQRAAAAGVAAGEDVGVEQLARAHHGPAHQRQRRDPRQRAVAAPAGGGGGRGRSGRSCRRCAGRRRRALEHRQASGARWAPFML